MHILSIHAATHDSAAALFRDYDLLAAVQQERLTRRKGAGGQPVEAIEEVLAIAGLARRDVDVLVLSRAHYPVRFFNGFNAYKRLEDGVNRYFGKHRNRDVVDEMRRAGTASANAVFNTAAFLAQNELRPDIPVLFSNHHYAHGLSALFHTGTGTYGLIYTADGGGDTVHYSHRLLRDGTLECLFGDDRGLAQKRRVDSLGLAYGFATQALGYRMNRHEGKLTGLAGFGKPTRGRGHRRSFHRRRRRTDRQRLRLRRRHARGRDHEAVAEHLRSPPDMAASIQLVLEDKILASVRLLLERPGQRRLAVAGGVFANVRLNRLLCEAADLDEIFIFPAMGDEGLVIGGALQYLLERDGSRVWLDRRRRLDNIYWGRDYSADIARALAAAADIRKPARRSGRRDVGTAHRRFGRRHL